MPPVAKQGWICICAVALGVLLGSQPGTLIAHGQNFQSVTNMSDLELLVNEPWTNSNCIMPPGNFAYNTDLGVLTYLDGFSSNFLSSLSPETNSGLEMFHISVWETNTTPRQRFYLNAAGVAAYTTTVSLSGYPSNSIVASYGAVPSYLSGTNINQWLDDRDPIRQRVLFTLISESNSEAYYTAMTNALTVTVDVTNTFSLLDVYSNDIAFVKTATREDGLFEYYLHAPTNILQLDMYISTNLMDNLGGWSLPVKLTHNSDPLHGLQIGTNSPTFFTIGNPAIDSDGDGLSDGLEQWIFGTNPNNADSDAMA